MSDISATKIREFCATVNYSKNQQEQEEFNRTLLTSAREAVDGSLIGAPFSRLWGSVVGCLFCEPVKWGKFASTLSLTAERVNDSLQLTFAGMNAGINRSTNVMIGGPNHTPQNPHTTPSLAQSALNRLISRIQPAIAADIVNENLSEDARINERAYNKYFIASSVVGVLATITSVGILLGALAIKTSR